MDAKTYRKVLSCKACIPETSEMCEAIASICNSLAASEIPPEITAPMRAVRIIAISKTDGGIRPIGIGEVIRRAITRTLAKVIKEDVKIATGSVQCSGLPGACEAAIKATETAYQNGKTILIMDAQSAFNNLSRSKTLLSASAHVPDAYQLFRNFYSAQTTAFYDGKPININEGIIQGCGLSSSFYDVGIKPLADTMRDERVAQIWVCDDLSASGSPEELKKWYKKLKEKGDEYGYLPKPGKCHVVSKDPNVPRIFKEEVENGELKISEGARYLGAPIGTEDFKKIFLKEKIEAHLKKIQKLTQLAKTSPHSAYFIHQTCTQHELTFLQRIANLEEFLSEVELERKKMVEVLCNKKIIKPRKWNEISLPTRHGGLGINVTSLSEEANAQYSKCEVVSDDLKKKLINQDHTLPLKPDLKELKKLQEKNMKRKAEEVRDGG